MATVRRALQQDRGAIARLHREQIPWGLLSNLGPEFVDAFYAVLLRSTVGFGFVAEQNSRPVGFASGVVNWRRLYVEFLLRRSRIALRGAWMSLRQARLKRVLETSRYAADRDLPAAELVAIAVTPEMRGTGVAVALVDEVLNEFRSRGVRAVRVTTSAENERAGALYERSGFRMLARREIHPGHVASVYVATLDQQDRIGTANLDRIGG